MFYRILIFISLLIASCNQQPLNPSLISWQSSFYMNDGDSATPYYKEHDKFIQQHMKAVYKDDTIYASTIKEENACGEPVASIMNSNDTLFLGSQDNSKYACTSVKFLKFSYSSN